jgi:glycerol kinase
MAFQTLDVIRAMEQDSGVRLRELRVDGGASMNNPLMQFQADLSGRRVKRPVVSETTALGAAYLAGLAVGFWKSQSEVTKNWALDVELEPAMSAAERKRRIRGWERAVERAKGWIES